MPLVCSCRRLDCFANSGKLCDCLLNHPLSNTTSRCEPRASAPQARCIMPAPVAAHKRASTRSGAQCSRMQAHAAQCPKMLCQSYVQAELMRAHSAGSKERQAQGSAVKCAAKLQCCVQIWRSHDNSTMHHRRCCASCSMALQCLCTREVRLCEPSLATVHRHLATQRGRSWRLVWEPPPRGAML